jgi:hypothetical protein
MLVVVVESRLHRLDIEVELVGDLIEGPALSTDDLTDLKDADSRPLDSGFSVADIRRLDASNRGTHHSIRLRDA